MAKQPVIIMWTDILFNLTRGTTNKINRNLKIHGFIGLSIVILCSSVLSDYQRRLVTWYK